jgi:hypothetical protein
MSGRRWLAVLVLLLPTSAFAQSSAPGAPGTSGDVDRLHIFWQAAIASPGPYLLDLGGGIIDQISGFPKEWTGGKGFGQRTLARVGSGLASDAIGHTVAAVIKHRVLYEPCECSGGWGRTLHALGRGFVTRTDSGEIRPHVSIFVAKAAAAGLENAWYPDSYRGFDIAREAVVGVGVNAALNVGREFAPELKRLFRMH